MLQHAWNEVIVLNKLFICDVFFAPGKLLALDTPAAKRYKRIELPGTVADSSSSPAASTSSATTSSHEVSPPLVTRAELGPCTFEIGSGSYSRVYRVSWGNQLVAVKCLPPSNKQMMRQSRVAMCNEIHSLSTLGVRRGSRSVSITRNSALPSRR